MNNRFGRLEEVRVLGIASILDLRFKTKAFCLEDNKGAVAALKNELQVIQETSRVDVTSPPKKKKSKSVLWKDHDEEVGKAKRIFSTSGQVLSKRRSSLSNENAHMLIFLHGNLK